MISLNKEQSRIVASDLCWKRVLAGAGSGKTTVIIERIAFLIDQGMTPDRILAITFTRKAAGEMRQRLVKRLGKEQRDEVFGFPKKQGSPGANMPWIGTIHAFAWHWLKKCGQVSGLKIASSEQMEQLAWRLAVPYRELSGPLPLRQWIFRQDMQMPTESNLDTNQPFMSDYFRDLARSKEAKGLLSFDDLVPRLVAYLQANEQPLIQLQKSFSSIFVDEFQDTSPDQIQLIKLLLTNQTDFLAVGDDYQAIYGFRGADMTTLTRFNDHFPRSKSYYLVQNFRSIQPIVSLCNKILNLNSEKVKKRMVSARKNPLDRAGKRPGFYFFADWLQQRHWILTEYLSRILPARTLPSTVSDVENPISKNNFDYLPKTTAILLRTNAQCYELKQMGQPKNAPNVQIMTVHQSKGLEFDQVLVAGITNNVFPHRDGDISEERRLLFVAASRARFHLDFAIVADGSAITKGFWRELGIAYLWAPLNDRRLQNNEPNERY